MQADIFDLKRVRKDYATIKEILDIPYLLEVQVRSYSEFLQKDVPPEERKEIGMQRVFHQVFPIKDFYETSELRFVSYRLGKPKYDIEDCILKGLTYAAPLRVTVQLVIYDVQEGVKTGQIRAIKEQEVYFGEIPLMTSTGHFIINGTPRVVVNQLHRSPGVFFDQEIPKAYAGRPLYFARIIPYRGSWIDFEFDQKDIIYVRIDRRRRMPATVFLKALGYSTTKLLRAFYETEKIYLVDGGFRKRVSRELLLGQKAPSDILDPSTEEVIIRKGRKITEGILKKMEAIGVTEIAVEDDTLVGKVLAQDVVDPATGDIIAEANQELTEERIREIRERGIREIEIVLIEERRRSPALRETLLMDPITLSPEEKKRCLLVDPEEAIAQREKEKALIEIYRRLRPGDPPTLETAKALFENLFFKPERYDLSSVGRMKMNHKLGLDVPLEVTTLRPEDILEVVKYLVGLREGKGSIDDIDHLGNRRVRTVGELLENQFHIGLVRVERAVKEKMSLQEVEALMPHDLINSKPLTAVLREFFGSSQLSQFMDQTNPLSEITHKRRLSALGPGGLSRERAGFEARDVHPSHYGRICPIETPEGPNIGLIVSLGTYARVNEYGFIETPYRKVKMGRVTGEIEYLFALDEEKYTIAQANVPLDSSGRIKAEMVPARRRGEFVMVRPEEVDYIDISPKQLVSVSSSLIPFLENDDANRALMGSNMQRQAVSLLKTEAPLIGTGMERVVARDSGVTVMARRGGVVESVDAERIVIRAEEEEGDGVGVDIYNLVKYQRSNQGTCINQRPIVSKGERVKKGDVIADGPSTERGELALGRNVLVAFMPWGGYNFEDSILISEKLLKEDIYTSIHIEELECVARETKLGKEEITRDIPNVGEDQLKDLDESGIIRIGAEVKPGDILVGKITPKGETQLTPEEKLLRAIFGEKASDVKDTSLRVPHGVEGVVIDAKILTRRGTEKDKRAKEIEEAEKERILKEAEAQMKIIEDHIRKRISELLLGKRLIAPWTVSGKREPIAPEGTVITEELLELQPWERWREIPVDPSTRAEVDHLIEGGGREIERIRREAQEKLKGLEGGDELPPGVIKVVKVYIAMKRKLSVGDKLSGRHGNKGIVSRILPEEDMPYLEDGTPVDMVLNPLGVPSRMNLGQILETHLGWAAKGLGDKVRAFLKGDGAELSEEELEELRRFLMDIFSEKEVRDALAEASREQLLGFARKLQDGIFMSVPVFDGPSEEEIRYALVKAGLPPSGQTVLYDGRTGEPFDHKVTVGYMYMLKLHHLVEDKIHARSIGPYSLITQQPLGGKAQFGGQRLGEMEVWALEAYGAAYSLQEFLTVKSDDVGGRTRAYEAIVKGKTDVLEPGIPESFNVLVKELQGLCLNVELIEKEEEEKPKTEGGGRP